MFLSRLKLKNFRNFSDLNLKFNKNINIFIGNNAQGKTNILESIYFLSIVRSHRTNNDLNLIKENSLYMKIDASVIYNENSKNFSILLNEKGKKVMINNLVQKKLSNYLSNLNVIIFCPDDLEIVKGTPSIRRRFLNIEISQLNNNYLINLKEYNKLLKQRNEYLKQKNNFTFDKTYYEIITNKLIKKNIILIKYRYDFVDKLNNYLLDIFNKITSYGNLKIKYESFISKEELLEENVVNNITEKFNKLLNSELLQKTTLIGCHKDDFKILLNDLNINEFGSQGQQRLSILCMKLSEIEVFINEYKIKPIVLLDDIFSELDEIKKTNIIKYLKKDVQMFITTTEINNIDEKIKNTAQIFKVNSGVVTKEE